jgi:glycerophosphoryl diester phosphodiesterase
MTKQPNPPLAVPSVIGHRGAAGHAPENTLASFTKAAALGARWVEFDVRLTADGETVVFHDDTLERTTDGRGRVSDATLTRIKKLDAGRWFGKDFAGEPVPSLADALAGLERLGLGANIELKSDSDAAREAETGRIVAETLRALWPKALPAPVISSFRLPALKAAGDAAPEFPRALLVIELDRDWQRRAQDLSCVAVHCRERELTAQLARQVRDRGYGLRCFTVNDRARAKTLFGWGVESVFSDYPDRLLDI